MADLATPSAAAMATAGTSNAATVGKDKNVPPPRPERPDDESYKAELAKAEKELRSAEERMVRTTPFIKCTCGHYTHPRKR